MRINNEAEKGLSEPLKIKITAVHPHSSHRMILEQSQK